jgi:uncharacterized membrane protein YebE (DUF533 family)
MQEQGRQSGIARFASESQWTKAKSNYGKAASGALSVAGGALLLAAGLSNPVGWALLAGAGLLGLGFMAYKKYKKHQQGKELNNPDYQRALRANGIHVPTDEELGPGKWSDMLTTKSSRRQDMVRGLIATRLAQAEGADANLREIAGHLGIRKRTEDENPLVGPDEQRIKSFARALEY